MAAGVAGRVRFLQVVVAEMVFGLLVFLVTASLVGQAPRHCRYLVPVKSVPGILACSEYPHPMVKP
jgi:hypothetical protein